MKPKLWAGLAVALLAAISATLFFSDDLRSTMKPQSQPTRSGAEARPSSDSTDQPEAAALPTTVATPPEGLEIATLGSGCFWCTEAVFQRLKGVESVASGYSGGEVANPTYPQVCSGTTGHAEAVQITYDPNVISFAELLEVFWKLHDPTTLNRQGNDAGTQYRSAIFYHTERQRELAEHCKAELDKSGAYSDPIVTEITKFSNFYPAEDYHQNYFNENGGAGYCRFIIVPKVDKLKKVFAEKLK
jgi:peptide-methionine (S)-S-oxide reductase